MPTITIELDETDDKLLAEIQTQLGLPSKEEALKAALRFRHLMSKTLKTGHRVIFQGGGATGEFGAVLRRKPLKPRRYDLEVSKIISETIGKEIQFRPYEVVKKFEWDSAQGVAKNVISGKTLGEIPLTYLDDSYLPSFDVGKLK